jgi:serine/threonine-protein kinase
MDFGIARSQSFELTRTGMSVGTPSYMAPEQVQAQRVDHRADIYSFGILAFELISGKRPVEGDTIEAIFYRILHEPLPLEILETSGAPQRLIALIAQCTDKKAELRPKSAEEVCAGLDRLPGYAATSLPRQRPTQTSFVWSWPRRLATGFVGLLLLILILFVVVPTRPHSKQPEPAPKNPPSGQGVPNHMTFVPPGEFVYRPHGKAPRTISVKAFYIDEHLVTWEDFRPFCAVAGARCPQQAQSADVAEPAVYVDFELAKSFAKWAGKRLPTANELERFLPHRSENNAGPKQPEPSGSSPFDSGKSPGEGPFHGVIFFDGPSNTGRKEKGLWEFTSDTAHPTKAAVLAYALLLEPPPTTEEPWVYLHSNGRLSSPFTQGIADGWSICPSRFRAKDISFRCARDTN